MIAGILHLEDIDFDEEDCSVGSVVTIPPTERLALERAAEQFANTIEEPEHVLTKREILTPRVTTDCEPRRAGSQVHV